MAHGSAPRQRRGPRDARRRGTDWPASRFAERGHRGGRHRSSSTRPTRDGSLCGAWPRSAVAELGRRGRRPGGRTPRLGVTAVRCVSLGRGDLAGATSCAARVTEHGLGVDSAARRPWPTIAALLTMAAVVHVVLSLPNGVLKHEGPPSWRASPGTSSPSRSSATTPAVRRSSRPGPWRWVGASPSSPSALPGDFARATSTPRP